MFNPRRVKKIWVNLAQKHARNQFSCRGSGQIKQRMFDVRLMSITPQRAVHSGNAWIQC
jgi:hypothetical protein